MAWEISASELNYFWMAVYPRIVGIIWRDDIPEREIRPEAIDGAPADPRRPKRFMIARIREIIDALRAEPRPPRDTIRRMRALIKPLSKMEIGIIPGFNYDFLLHSRGIDLPLPERPDDLSYVFQRYQFREVGPSAMALPNLNTGDSFDFRGVAAAAFMTAAPAAMATNGTMALMTAAGPAPGPAAPRRVSMWLADYAEAQRTERGWQWYIRGSELGAIMTSLPRVIAQVWYDMERAKTILASFESPSEQVEAIVSDYVRRYREEPRRLFEDRIEVRFDPDLPMETGAEGTTDCILRDTGATLPFPNPPAMEDLFTAWADGAAANPVFTSSHKCC